MDEKDMLAFPEASKPAKAKKKKAAAAPPPAKPEPKPRIVCHTKNGPVDLDELPPVKATLSAPPSLANSNVSAKKVK